MRGDEVWCWKDDSLLEAFQTALVKRADARLVLISTAASSLDSQLGRLRTRALSVEQMRSGAHLDASAGGLSSIRPSWEPAGRLAVPVAAASPFRSPISTWIFSARSLGSRAASIWKPTE
jgi:hypothetical protein